MLWLCTAYEVIAYLLLKNLDPVFGSHRSLWQLILDLR
jgi:hypothetical protein